MDLRLSKALNFSMCSFIQHRIHPQRSKVRRFLLKLAPRMDDDREAFEFAYALYLARQKRANNGEFRRAFGLLWLQTAR